MSFAQDELWCMERLAPGSPAHTLCRGWEASGPLDIGALRGAWREVVRRHEILRAILVTDDGQPALQIGGEPDPQSFTEIAGPPAGQAGADRQCAEPGNGPMSPVGGPLARLAVARLAPQRHLVLMTLHRAVADDRSVAIIVNDLSACYVAAVCGQQAGAALPGPATPYTDYARWQREQAGTERYQELRRWWAATLTSAPPLLTLPADCTAPPEPSWRGGAVRFDWGEDVSRLLADRCRDLATEPWVLLLAAFQAVLWRYSGQDRVPVGMPVTMPIPAELANPVGPLDNIVVICTDFSGRPTFREAVARTARSAREALDHREIPFPRLVRDLNLDRHPRRLPYCDALFVAGDTTAPELKLPPAAVSPRDADSAAIRADLTLAVAGSSAAGSLSFGGSRFGAESARRVAEHIRTLLVAGLRSPDLPVDALALDGPDRIHATLRAADRVSGAAAPDQSVPELVHQQARRRPDAVAVAFSDQVITYRELKQHAAAIARALGGGAGVTGQPVAVRMAPGRWHAAALLGVLDAGAHVICLGTGDAGARGQAALAAIRPAWLVLDGAAPGTELVSWYRDELGGRVLDISALRDEAATPDSSDTRAEPPDPSPGSHATLGELAYVAFTSGSTGSPKGIPQSHQTLAQFVTWFAGEFGIDPAARVAQWAAPGYDASLCEIFAALTAGATLYPVPDKIRANPEKLATWLAANRITILQTVPSFAKTLVKVIASRSSAGQLRSLKYLLLAGEPLPGELANEIRAELPWIRLVNLYGSTETILASWHEITGPVTGTVPVGRSIPGRQVLLLDAEDRPCPSGVIGEIVVRTPYVTPGYLGEDPSRGAVFREVSGLPAVDGGPPIGGNSAAAVGWYRTGDLGRLRWDGALEFCGRRDELIKFQGRRIELEDIETTLAAHESVADCAVVPVAGDDGLVHRLVAYVVPRGADEPTGEWRTSLRRVFGDSMLPVSFKTSARLLRNQGGKLDRRALAAMARQSSPSRELPK